MINRVMRNIAGYQTIVRRNRIIMSYLENKKIVVTGGAGFLGKNVVAKLKEFGCEDKNIFIPRSESYNLVNNVYVKMLYHHAKPDIVIHLAAVVGGIGANSENPGQFFYDNLMMGAQMMEQGRLNNIDKFVAVGTICCYPKFASVPFKEEDLWNGYPEETNAPYGLAKKMLLVQAQAYRQQYGFNAIYLLPVNLYGPGDNFDPDSSHVVPALIKKFIEAKVRNLHEVVVWGTGLATREFLYVEDAAAAIVKATLKYDKPEPINLGSSFEISIAGVANSIAKVVNYKGKIVFDTSKPDGQPRRKLDVSKAKREFGFVSETSFLEGLGKTIKWYEQSIERASEKT